MQGIKKHIFLALILTAVVSCNVDTVKVQIQPYELIHDNGSKVWLLKHQIINGRETIPSNRADRWVMVFYRDRTFVLSTLATFGEFSKLRGRFSISEDVIISEKNFTGLNTWLREQGFTVEEVPYAEIAKQEGLLRCSTLPLIRD